MSETEYSKLKDAIANLQREYEKLKFIQQGGLQSVSEAKQYDFEQTAKNSVVQCFEICCDTAWKHLKKYLEEVRGMADVPNSPKAIFRSAHESNAISYDMAQQFFTYNSIRNDTAHDYQQQKAEAALKQIEAFIQDVTELYNTMMADQ